MDSNEILNNKTILYIALYKYIYYFTNAGYQGLDLLFAPRAGLKKKRKIIISFITFYLFTNTSFLGFKLRSGLKKFKVEIKKNTKNELKDYN